MNHASSEKLAFARSFLFVPGDRADRIPKALDTQADIVIIDLEDAVAPNQKSVARQVILDTWSDLSAAQRQRLIIRSNPFGTSEWLADMTLLRRLHAQGLTGLMLPKAESAISLRNIGAQLPNLQLIPLIESAKGFANLDAIAATPSVIRLALGHLDLQVDLRMRCGPNEEELNAARWAMVLSSRCHDLAGPIDGVTAAVKDLDLLQTDTNRSLRFGFSAKLCIHPQQIELVHQTFTPTPHEVQWAHKVIQAMQQSISGAVAVDGKMVDAPVIRMAEQILLRMDIASRPS